MLLIQVCHICSLAFLVLFGSLFDFFVYLIRTTGRSEGKTLEIKYIISGVDHFAPPPPPPPPPPPRIFEMINVQQIC